MSSRPQRAISAAAIRASRRKVGSDDAVSKSDATETNTREVEEWAHLPPAPNGHIRQACANDSDLDIFGGAAAMDGDTAPEAVLNDDSVGAHAMVDADTKRPSWGTAGMPLFEGTGIPG